jgi:hypothetical protein
MVRSPCRTFIADSIIANPVSYGHFHCAEALGLNSGGRSVSYSCLNGAGVPLHIMFPQPWFPTKAFPHPLACRSYDQSSSWSDQNYYSYDIVESLLWLSIESSVNSFRQDTLKLDPIRWFGENTVCRSLYLSNKIPFVMMWSPSLVPKPKDWPEYVDVVGAFVEKSSTVRQDRKVRPHVKLPEIYSEAADRPAVTEEEDGSGLTKKAMHNISVDVRESDDFLSRPDTIESSMSTVSLENSRLNAFYAPNRASSPPFKQSRLRTSAGIGEAQKNSIRKPQQDEYSPSFELAHFLASGPPPIFIGFGSMVIKDPHSLIKTLLEAAALARVRVLVQSGWSAINETVFSELKSYAQQQHVLVKTAEDEDSEDGCYGGSNADKESPPSVDQPASVSSSRAATMQLTREWDANKDLFLLGPCPHPWLFKHVSAVVHHGGAGTTAAGLIAGTRNCAVTLVEFVTRYTWNCML